MPLTNKPFLYTTPQLFFLNLLSSRDSGDTLSGATVRSVHSGQTPQKWRHSILPLPQLDYKFKMDSAEWYADWATSLLSMTCHKNIDDESTSAGCV